MAIKIAGVTVIGDTRSLSSITSLDAQTVSTIETAISVGPNTMTDVQVSGIATFLSGPVLIGSGTSTGTAGQILQVAGVSSSVFIGGNVGVGNTNPASTLDVTGNARLTGVVTAVAFNGQVNSSGISTFNIITSSSGAAGTVTVNSNLFVAGNITAGGTSFVLNAGTLQIRDKDIVLGITTDALGNDVSTDDTANHGGISIASTQGSPLFNFPLSGINSLPTTYKQFMWVKGGSYGAGTTDAWLSNYAVGVGSTQVPSGTRFAVSNIQFTDNVINTIGLTVTGGISSFTNTPVLIGGGTSTGTANQSLQVTGVSSSAYIGGALGIGTINPTGVRLDVRGSARVSGSVTFNQTAADIFRIDAVQAPTTDMVSIGNTGFPITTAGVNNLQINFAGGSAAVEAGAARVEMTPGTTAGAIWNSWRVILPTAAGAGVTVNAFKCDNITPGAGTDNVLFAGNGWDNLINLNFTPIINGLGEYVWRINSPSGISTFAPGTTLLVGTGTSTGTTNQALQVGNVSAPLNAYVSGAAGISTTLPGGRLAVHDDSATPFNNPVVYLQRLNNITPTGIAVTNAELRIKGHSSNHKIYVEDQNANPLLLVTGIGSVGLGTTAPAQLFQVGAAGTLGFSTDNRVFVVTSAGNAGVGTLSPIAKLHVIGDARLTGVITASTFIGQVNSGFGTVTDITGRGLRYTGVSTFAPGSTVLIGTGTSTGTAGQILQVSGISSGVFIGGRTGIGITTPLAQLHVSPTSQTVIAGLFSGSSNVDMIHITQSGTGNAIYVEDQINDQSPFVVLNNGQVAIGTTAAVSTASLTVTDGNVGFSNLSNNPLGYQPQAIFVGSVDSTSECVIQNMNSGTSASADLCLSGNTGTYVNNFIDLGVNGANFNQSWWTVNSALDGYLYNQDGGLSIGVATNLSSKYISFFLGGLLVDNEKMRITQSGVIGIGTTVMTGTPNQLLQVGSATSTAGAFIAGNLGVGNTNPISKLDIVGDAKLTGVVTAITFNGQINAGFATIASLTGTGISITGFSTFASGPVVIGTGTSTGTAGQILQVAGVSSSVFIGGALGIGTAPRSPSTLFVNGTAFVSGVATVQGNLVLRNPANTFGYTVTSAAIAANRNLFVPLLTGDAGIAVTANFTQTWSNQNTFGSAAFILSQTTQNINLGSTQTTGQLSVGGVSQTGIQTIGQSTVSHTLEIASGVSAAGTTKTINFGTGGLTNSLTAITVGPSAGLGTVFINTSTSLGIGSASPTSRLDIVGDAKLTGVVTAVTFSGQVNAGFATISNLLGVGASISGFSTFLSGPVVIGTGTSTGTADQVLQVSGISSHAYIGGRLGVGETNPGVQLQVTRGSATSTTAFRIFSGGSATNVNLAFGRTSEETTIGFAGAAGFGFNSAVQGDFFISNTFANGRLLLGSSGTQPAVTIDGSNNFLIGTTISSGTGVLQLGSPTVSRNAYISGSLGIGTTNPIQQLDVFGNGRFTGVVTATTFNGNVNSSGLSTFLSGPVLIGTGTSTGTALQALQVGTLVSPLGAFISGSVGVGTTNPGLKLNVVGATGISGVNTTFTAITQNIAKFLILSTQTTTGAATTLTTDGSNVPTTSNVHIIPANAAIAFRGTVVANVTNGGNTRVWEFRGAIKRGSATSSTTLVGTPSINDVAFDAGASGWSISLGADTNLGAIAVNVVGAASTTIRWVCKMESTEVTY